MSRLDPAAGLRWTQGNRLELLENGEAFYRRVFAAIDAARTELQLETFILFEDEVGWALQRRLLDAARRGVKIRVLVDGYGSPGFSPGFLDPLVQAGVDFRAFDPQPTLLGMRLNLFRRMHRKLLVVDGARAFVGGINYSADHLRTFGPDAKQDYAVEVEGPVVAGIHRFVREGAAGATPAAGAETETQGRADAAFVVRDNRHHRTDIERAYREAIRAAKSEIIIANAYFFPGYGFLRELRHAARRGVTVRLILQGEPDVPAAMLAARSLYRHLMRDGVEIYEYCARPFHGKVALVDEEWATVGSSNLDPLSLSLNLEANLLVRDRMFNRQLRARMQRMWRDDCTPVAAAAAARGRRWWLPSSLLYHVLRRFPAWAGWLPAHRPRVVPLAEATRGGRAGAAAQAAGSAGHDAVAPRGRRRA
ncbi:cardiolipin synthase ClsB [Pseudoxanthomonas sp. 10H]|uniref:cardiolipin synthase ClsB n=1 Tax=Pseudoxanthomonas sp. 10H TaxID=3242729 RepID=UPI0035564289